MVNNFSRGQDSTVKDNLIQNSSVIPISSRASHHAHRQLRRCSCKTGTVGCRFCSLQDPIDKNIQDRSLGITHSYHMVPPPVRQHGGSRHPKTIPRTVSGKKPSLTRAGDMAHANPPMHLARPVITGHGRFILEGTALLSHPKFNRKAIRHSQVKGAVCCDVYAICSIEKLSTIDPSCHSLGTTRGTKTIIQTRCIKENDASCLVQLPIGDKASRQRRGNRHLYDKGATVFAF